MRIADSAELPLAAFQRAAEARLAEARRAIERAAAAPSGASPPAVHLADVVVLSPEARAAHGRLLREPPDLAQLARLFTEALRAPASGRQSAFQALSAALAHAGVAPDDVPANPAELAQLAALLRSALPSTPVHESGAALIAAWLLVGRAAPGIELPPALLALLATWRERRGRATGPKRRLGGRRG